MANGSFVERLVAHARLPLVAGLDSARPVIHIFQAGGAGLRQVGTVNADAPEYPAKSWERYDRVPAIAWHPHEPKLLATGPAGLCEWTPQGTSVVPDAPSGAAYRHLAFSPDGSTLWASPSSSGEEETSEALDLASGARRSIRWWDTGVVEHPGGGLLATLASDQASSLLLFARPDDSAPARMRVFRHALMLDVDGYESPVFSPDGRFLALRGNAYVHSLDVFEFPTLRTVLRTTLGSSEQALSLHNTVFARHSGLLLVGTAEGSMAAIDLDGDAAVEHRVGDAPVNALAVLASDELVVADQTGRVTVMAGPGDAQVSDDAAAQARDRVAAYLAATTEVPEDADWRTDLVLSDGVRSWAPGDLERVTTAREADPMWLRLRAAINQHLDPLA